MPRQRSSYLGACRTSTSSNPSGTITPKRSSTGLVIDRQIQIGQLARLYNPIALNNRPASSIPVPAERDVLPTLLLSADPLPPVGFLREACHFLLYPPRILWPCYYGDSAPNKGEIWRWSETTDTNDVSKSVLRKLTLCRVTDTWLTNKWL